MNRVWSGRDALTLGATPRPRKIIGICAIVLRSTIHLILVCGRSIGYARSIRGEVPSLRRVLRVDCRTRSRVWLGVELPPWGFGCLVLILETEFPYDPILVNVDGLSHTRWIAYSDNRFNLSISHQREQVWSKHTQASIIQNQPSTINGRGTWNGV